MVLDGRLLEAVGAVVVADKDVGVDVAEADEVVAFGLAGLDAGFVAGDTSVDDAEGEDLVWFSSLRCTWNVWRL